MTDKDWYREADSGIYREEKSNKLLWIAPSLIRFHKEQVVWLIEHLPLLEDGKWPELPGGNYIDPAVGRTGVNSHAYFEIPCWYYGEIERRLAMTEDDGAKLESEVQAGIEPLSRESLKALEYISGWARKKESYESH